MSAENNSNIAATPANKQESTMTTTTTTTTNEFDSTVVSTNVIDTAKEDTMTINTPKEEAVTVDNTTSQVTTPTATPWDARFLSAIEGNNFPEEFRTLVLAHFKELQAHPSLWKEQPATKQLEEFISNQLPLENALCALNLDSWGSLNNGGFIGQHFSPFFKARLDFLEKSQEQEEAKQTEHDTNREAERLEAEREAQPKAEKSLSPRAQNIRRVVDAAGVFTNLRRAMRAVHRRIGWKPSPSVVLGSSGHDMKVIKSTTGKDNVGLTPFLQALNVAGIPDDDILTIEANNASQEAIERFVLSFVRDGWRPLSARVLMRCFDKSGRPLPGADVIQGLSEVLGTFNNVRSYASFLSAPTVGHVYYGAEQDSAPCTDRDGGEPQDILWVSGKAKELFPGLNGTEGGLVASEKAMEAIFGDKTPGQPRLIVNKNGGDEQFKAMVKGNFQVVAARLFKLGDQWVALTRADFSEDEVGKAKWREGFDFILIEDDTPKGVGKPNLQTGDLVVWPDLWKYVTGWLIAKAPEKAAMSLASYQVPALLSHNEDDWVKLSSAVNALVGKRVDVTYNLTLKDVKSLNLPVKEEAELDKLNKWLASKAPSSARSSRQNHLGLGLSVVTGYIHMNTILSRGWLVVGNEFGGLKGKALHKRMETFKVDDVCGHKNPILNANQIFVGKLLRLADIDKLLAYQKAVVDNEDLSGFSDAALMQTTLDAVLGHHGDNQLHRVNCLKWIKAFAPSLTRGSILMNADDVADMAGDDDGDTLGFMVNNEHALTAYSKIKDQAKGNKSYKIETNKNAQRPNVIGEKSYGEMLTAKDADLKKMVLYIVAPNKGQGPVGFLANIATIINTYFKKVKNSSGGMKHANIWVERLQAVVDYMEQTAIDLQKRDYATADLTRWTSGDISEDAIGNRSIVPGYDMPALGYKFINREHFDPLNFSQKQYMGHLVPTNIPQIRHHWNGSYMDAVTPLDAQYNIGAVGSWLIWECISLLVTNKPVAWHDDMPQEAKGGIDVTAVNFTDNCPDLENFFEIYPCSEEIQNAVRQLWVQKVSQLYSWKGAPKNRPYVVKAPPGLELNHKIALTHLANYAVAEKPDINTEELVSKVKSTFNMGSLNAASLKFWVEMVLDGFYVEAAVSNNLKADSERFQNSSERSGIEALRHLLNSLENETAFRKLSQGAFDYLNPHNANGVDGRDDKIHLLALVFAWWCINFGDCWVYDAALKEISKYTNGEEKIPLYRHWMKQAGFSEATAKKVVHFFSHRYNKDNSARPTVDITNAIEDFVSRLDSSRQETLQARSSWFIDEGIGAFIKAKEQEEIISNRYDLLAQMGEVIKVYEDERAGWDDTQIAVEIMLLAFDEAKPVWFTKIMNQLKEIAKSILPEDELKKLPKGKSPERSKHLKGKKAAELISTIESFPKTKMPAIELLDLCLDPRSNPVAEIFMKELLLAVGPVMNVERAWRRFDTIESKVGSWYSDLGQWSTRTRKDRETGEKVSRKYFRANTRVEWSLPDGFEAYISRTLLDSGVSHWSLNRIIGHTVKAWRYWDACQFMLETTPDVCLVYGLGHLVSNAASVYVQNKRKATGNNNTAYRYQRKELMAELKVLAGDLSNQLKGQDDPWFNTFKHFMSAEEARLKAYDESPLVATWGGMQFPITWGFELRSFPGELTKKKLNGRAMNAIITAGKKNPYWYEQPQYSVETVDNKQVSVPDVTTALQPVWKNIMRAVPYAKPKGRKDLDSRAREILGADDVDDIVDLVPFELEDGRMNYSDWQSFIFDLIKQEDSTVDALIPATLWWKSNVGRIAFLQNADEPGMDSIGARIQKSMLRVPAAEIRHHLTDLFSGDFVKPVYKTVTEDSIVAFSKFINLLMGNN